MASTICQALLNGLAPQRRSLDAVDATASAAAAATTAAECEYGPHGIGLFTGQEDAMRLLCLEERAALASDGAGAGAGAAAGAAGGAGGDMYQPNARDGASGGGSGWGGGSEAWAYTRSEFSST